MAKQLAGLVLVIAAAQGFWPGRALAGNLRVDVADDLVRLDRAVDWTRGKMIAVLDDRRHKTLDAFARESLSAMTGKESFPGLSPTASLLEWVFNRQAYADSPVIYIKESGLRVHLTAHMPEAARQRIRSTGYMTLRELSDPVVRERVRELEPRFEMGKAIGRFRHAEAVASFADQMLRFVPRPGDATGMEMWYSPKELLAAAPAEVWREAGTERESTLRQLGLPTSLVDISESQAAMILGPWFELQSAWLARDAGRVQSSLDRLAERLPQLAAEGVYPSLQRRILEARYYGMGKFTWGYLLYMLGLLVSVCALVTRWKTPWLIAVLITAAALGLHGYGVGLRWQILGRIPVANMFEAITAAAFGAVALALLLEVLLRRRVFALAGCACGFFGMLLGDQVLPGAVTPMMGILDDLMLRIHTVCIIFSYGMIFVAAIVSCVYLISYYVSRHPAPTLETALIGGVVGTSLLVLSLWAFRQPTGLVSASGIVKLAGASYWFGLASVVLAVVMTVMISLRRFGTTLAALALLLIAAITMWVGSYGFVRGMGWTIMGTSVLVGLVALISLVTRRAGGAALTAWAPEMYSDGGRGWLAGLDKCQQLILGMVFVLLFVGTILGAVWADYSWGRPWGWDPKEVFAMNTWIIYVILIHVRFVVKERGLWTAWMSVAGCLMMAFNWCFVNFYIVGLHSYA
ncbi:MAG: cytochrome c biogenesis protein CcsA [Phycisphaerae bacterium]|nr:cytochrome c biogenesis protein CcsA [Phycisphaerae bacterium]MCZ2399928.1 cytochrome c biogenesis protein CcsA [Phycisphaerae bacterium]NUQ49170.1 cytochrome c biogenesis protein CcsA [Phycisphaerae bacterium]